MYNVRYMVSVLITRIYGLFQFNNHFIKHHTKVRQPLEALQLSNNLNICIGAKVTDCSYCIRPQSFGSLTESSLTKSSNGLHTTWPNTMGEMAAYSMLFHYTKAQPLMDGLKGGPAGKRAYM